MKVPRILSVILSGLFAVTPIFAARAPDAVEKTIVLRGEAASSLAELLGLTPGKPSVSLRLGPSDAWLVYLLKQDTKVPLSNDNDGSPPRDNVVELHSSPVASLTLSPFWLDLGTRLPDEKPGYYSFDSPFISQKLDSDDPWTHVVQRLQRARDWKASARVKIERCFSSTDGVGICVEVIDQETYAGSNVVHGYAVIVTAHVKGE